MSFREVFTSKNSLQNNCTISRAEWKISLAMKVFRPNWDKLLHAIAQSRAAPHTLVSQISYFIYDSLLSWQNCVNFSEIRGEDIRIKFCLKPALIVWAFPRMPLHHHLHRAVALTVCHEIHHVEETQNIDKFQFMTISLFIFGGVRGFHFWIFCGR